MHTISIIIPVYNESLNIDKMHFAIREIFDNKLEEKLELIFVNDGSNDNSLEILKKIASQDNEVKIISFTRNFGHQAAITAGLNSANGDALITMDCDFQDPPELIPVFINEWKNNYKIVYGRRILRNDGFLKKITAKLYYKLLHFFSEVKISGNIGDYRLIDKSVMETIRANNVNTDYIRGLLPWFGFKSTIVDYDRPKRVAGKTGFSLLKMIRLGLKGLLSFSILPLRLGLFVGISVIFSGIVFVIYLLYNYLINDEFYKLLEWLAAFTYILLGFLFVLIWILAEYIFSISNNVKGMPMYVVDEVIENKKD
ncbi:MAG: glycosyltransferase family 2 protein [Bacteroidota bacterium]